MSGSCCWNVLPNAQLNESTRVGYIRIVTLLVQRFRNVDTIFPATAEVRGPRSRGMNAGIPQIDHQRTLGVRHPMVWRGIASEEKSDPAQIQKKLDDMVRKAIEKYPPKK